MTDRTLTDWCHSDGSMYTVPTEILDKLRAAEARAAEAEAVIAEALSAMGNADEFSRLRKILSATPSPVLAARDACIAELECLLASNHKAYLSVIGADHE